MKPEFEGRLSPGNNLELELPDGSTVEARLEYDDVSRFPWEEGDCNGVVSEWRDKESKAPGERILCTDDRNREARFYDVQATMQKQKDVWGEAVPQCKVCLKNKNAFAFTVAETNAKMQPAKMAIHTDSNDPRFHACRLESQREANARVIEADFQFLRAWCEDRWAYHVVILKHTLRDGYEKDHVEVCGGLEYGDLCDDDYPTEMANEMLAASGLVDEGSESMIAPTCAHDEGEDHMNCTDCGKCREDLDCQDRCGACGGHDCETTHPGVDEVDA